MRNKEIPEEFRPFFIPLAILQWALTIASLIHVFTHRNYRFGNRPLWAGVSFISFIGPLLYFAVGRGRK
jgi:hypothetical protein